MIATQTKSSTKVKALAIGKEGIRTEGLVDPSTLKL